MKKELKEIVTRADALMKAGTPMIVYDFETTGLSVETDRVLSFSAIKVVYKNGIFHEADRRDIFMNPGFHIPEAASSVNGITDETVKDCPHEEDVIRDIADFLGERPLLCGYNNISFDDKFLDKMLKRNLGIKLNPILDVDVILLARDAFPDMSHKLISVATHLGCEAGISFHKSIDDVIATFRVYSRISKKYLTEEADETEEAKVKVKVLSGKLWEKSERNQDGSISVRFRRIYFQTLPSVGKVYYDILRDRWHCDDSQVDLEDIAANALKLYGASDTDEMVAAAR